MDTYALVEAVGLDWRWQGIPGRTRGDAPETRAEPTRSPPVGHGA